MGTWSYIGRIQKAIAEVSPWFLQGKNRGTFLESVGLLFDNSIESFSQGLQLSQPLRCDPSSLPYMSGDRGIRVYPTEPIASQRYRLSQWYQLRRQFGTHVGEMRNLQPFFLPSTPIIRTVHQAGDGSTSTWHTLDAAGTYTVHRAANWNFDGVAAKWSRFWVIVYVDQLGLTQPNWDGGELWDGGQVWDGWYDTTAIDDMVAAINDAKSAHSVLWGVILAPDPATFDPTASVVVDPDGWSNLPAGNWGYITDPVTGQYTRQIGASWVYDLGQG